MKKVVPGSLKRNQLDFFSHIASSRFCRTCLLFPVLFFSVFVSSGYPAGSEKLLYQNPGQADWDFTSGLVRRELNRKPGQKTASDPGRVIRALMELECGESGTISSFDEKLLEAGLEDRSYDWGVKFDSGYRFSETRADIPRQTGYVGLTWDILKSGLLQEKSRDRQDKFQIGLARLREPAGRLQQQLPCREIALLQMFGTLKTALFELREELLVIEYRALREAYFSGRILLDELLKIEGKVKETQEALLLQRTLNSFELKSRSFFLPEEEIPLLQIRLEPLLQVVKEKAGNPEAIELRENILREKTNPLLKNSLKLYVRSGLDREEGETDYGTFVFGVRFTAPLGRWKRKENSLELEKNRFENTRRVQKKVLETVRLFNAYEEKLKNTVTTRYEELYSKERLRRVWLLNRKMRDGGSVVDVTRALSELTDIRIKALTRQEGLYLRLLHLFTRSGVGFKNEFVEGRQSTFSVSRGRAGKRSVYIWSDSFNTYSNEFLLQVFEAKSVSRAIVSFSTKSDIKKLEPFLYLARDSGVEVELMAGANEWIYPDRGPKVTSFTGRALSFADTVHMDVEPHTLDGYRKNEQEYKQLYLKMLQRVLEARGEGKSISVSIPLKWKGPFFEKIVKLVDRVYLMAYGITGYGEMERKISPFLQAGSGEKLVIALRPGDFSDEWEMEKFVDELFIRTGISEFAFHDFSAFLKTVTKESL